jgi:SSS family solute:Na+ symporter
MAVNMYSAIWTLLASLTIAIVVSVFTKPKPDSELKNLVMGLTPLPDQGPCPWYERPKIWASIVLIAIVALNIIFW